MKMRVRVVLITAAALLALGAAVFAAGEYSGPAGSENDPLVTLSYINDVFTGEVQSFYRKELQSQTDSLRDSLESRVEALEEACEAAGGAEAGLTFEELAIPSGSELICSAGTEVLLRSGSAYVVAREAPGLLDTSGGADLNKGEYLRKNHMYMVAGDDEGICADGSITVLVRGDYKII